jgi:hypothetical protein
VEKQAATLTTTWLEGDIDAKEQIGNMSQIEQQGGSTDALREASMVTRFQQQMEEEFGKLQTEQATKEESQLEEDWKQLKEVIKEAAEQTIGYQPK